MPPPQDLHIPGLIPIFSKAISCQDLVDNSEGVCFNAALMIARDFFLDALERKP